MYFPYWLSCICEINCIKRGEITDLEYFIFISSYNILIIIFPYCQHEIFGDKAPRMMHVD